MTSDLHWPADVEGDRFTLADLIAGPGPCDREAAVLGSGVPPLDREGLSGCLRQWADLLGRQGVGRGDRLGLVLPDGPGTAVISLAVSSCAIAAPLNPELSSAELAVHLAGMRCCAVLIPDEGHAAAQAAARSLGIPAWSVSCQAHSIGLEGARLEREPDSRPVLPGDLALLLPTSGTAATPKRVPLTHRNLCRAAQAIREVLALSAADRCLNFMPLFHIHGLSLLYASLAAGGSVACVGRFDPAAFPNWMREFQPTWFSGAPAMHRMMLDALRERPLADGPGPLRFIRSASAPMPPAWIPEMEAVFGVPFIEAYGMTEAGPQIASNRLPPHPRKRGSVGRAAGPEVAISDPQGRPLPAGEVGEVVARGASVVRGYDRDPEADADSFRSGWLRTGDLGYLDADGDLFITGRLSEVINRGGQKISPQQVENVLRQHPAVAQAVVFGVEHPVLGQLPAALVVPVRQDAGEGGAAILEGELQSWLASRVAPFQVPQPIRVVDSIPTGPGGKVRRRELAAFLAARVPEHRGGPASASAGDWSAVHQRLAALWEDVLGARPSGPEANFFSLGGHSLAATRLMTRIREVFGLDLPEAIVFQRPTVAGLSEELGRRLACRVAEGDWKLVRSAEPGGSAATLSFPLQRRPRSGPIPLSFAQQRLWFLDRVDAGPAYHMAVFLELTGPLDREALGAALGCVRDRHEILRTTFPVVAGEPVQQVAAGQGPVMIRELDAGSGDRAAGFEAAFLDEFERPFDLASGPLIRAAVASLDPGRHRLLVTVHHIVFDGWSTPVFLRDLASAYDALVRGQSPDLAPLEVQYADYAVCQREWCREPAFEGHLGYWRTQLHDAPALCTFPPDRPRPPVQTHRGASLHSRIEPQRAAALAGVAGRHGSTLYMVLLATVQAQLSKYSGQADCVVGTAVANRIHPGLEPLIGFFANTLVIRCDHAGVSDLPDWLQRVRGVFLEALAHQEVPFERLVDALHVNRDLSRMPLFQVMLVFQNLPGADPGRTQTLGPGLSARPLQLERHGAKFDLTLYCQESDGALNLTWLYNADLYDSATIDRLASHLDGMLRRLESGAMGSLSEWTRLPEEERRTVERLGCGPVRTDWERVCCHHLFEAAARATPEADAVISGPIAWSFGQLNSRANRLARRLRAEGVHTGVRVAVLVDRSADTVAGLLAILKAGGAFVGVDLSHPVERVRWILDDASVSVVITSGSGGAAPELLEGRRVVSAATLDDPGENGGDLGPISRPEDLAYIIHTSGTTGRPKGVTLSHANLGHYVRALGEVLGIQRGDRYLHTASFGFSSSVRQFALPLCSGVAVVVAEPPALRDPAALLDLVRDARITVLDLVPSHWRLLLEVPGDADAHRSLRMVLSASEPLPSDIARRWFRRWPHGVQCFNLYGQSETTGIVLAHACVGDGGGRTAVTPLGRPIPGLRVRVVGSDGQTVPVGVEGEIQVAGAGVGPGYLNDPKLTASRFFEDPADPAGTRWYRTGDLGRLRSDGCVEYLGRRDLQLKVRGVRVEPGEVEGLLMEHPDIRRCAVVADRSDPVAGARLVAFVEPGHGGTVGDAWVALLRAWLRNRLPPALVPSAVRVLERLPLNPNGKLDRAALARLAAESHTESRMPAGDFSPPRTAEEQCLTEVWCEVLRVERVGRDDNFFDRGGDSLLSVQAVMRARQAGLDHSLRLHFRHQTPAEACAAGLTFLPEAATRVPSEASVEPEAAGDAAPEVARPGGGTGEPAGRRVTVDSLRAFGREALEKAGLVAEGARVVTEVQLEATLRGQPTHHMDSIPRYARRVAAGRLNGRPVIWVEREDAVSACVDADNAPGQWAAMVAMGLAIRKAKVSGVGMVTVRRSNHLGAAGHYAWEAARQGLIGFCATNGPTILAPTGGVTPTFGNNPLGVGVPSGRHFPILLDIAMSVAPRGRIARQVAQGLPLPAGWILDRFGRPSTELADLAAGLGVPIGGHKGYGLAFILEILSGVLSGSGFALDHARERLKNDQTPADYGHWFLAVDPGRFLPLPEFAARVDRLIEQTRSGALAADAGEILVPGEREFRAREASLKDGAFLEPAAYRALCDYAEQAGLESRLQPVGT